MRKHPGRGPWKCKENVQWNTQFLRNMHTKRWRVRDDRVGLPQ